MNAWYVFYHAGKQSLRMRCWVKVLKVLHYKAGYEVRTEKYADGEIGSGPGFTIRSAYTPQGKYIGNPNMARLLCDKKGIAPELRTPKHNVCSVGKSKKNGMWNGWSHRAIAQFKTRKEGGRFAERASQ